MKRALRRGLDPDQRLAVEHTGRRLWVDAGAGSGKTRVLHAHAMDLIDVRSVPPEKILVATFTNEAADEVRVRLRTELSHAIARRVTVTTFHGYAARLLRAHGTRVEVPGDFRILGAAEAAQILGEAARDAGVEVDALARYVSRTKRSAPGDAPVQSSLDLPAFERAARRYAKALSDRSAVDFDDLIVLAVRLLEAHPEVRRTVFPPGSHLLIDEVQDLDATQLSLVCALAGSSRSVFAVGDRDQAIYGWRGSSPDVLAAFNARLGVEVISLPSNYRVPAQIFSVATAMLARCRGRAGKKLRAVRAGGAVEFSAHPSEIDEAAWVASRIEGLLRDGGEPVQIGVLTRTHGQSDALTEVLRVRGIAFAQRGKPYDDAAPTERLDAVLRAAVKLDEHTVLAGLAGLVPSARGTPLARLEAWARTHECSIEDALRAGHPRRGKASNLVPELQRRMRVLTALAKRADRTPIRVHDLCARIARHCGLEGTDDGRAWCARAVVFEQSHTNATVRAFVDECALRAASSTEPARVTVSTIHAAKGREFDIVFVMGLVERAFPLHRWNSPGPEDLDEERRLAYVAMTRARKLLVLTHGARAWWPGRKAVQSPFYSAAFKAHRATRQRSK